MRNPFPHRNYPMRVGLNKTEDKFALEARQMRNLVSVSTARRLLSAGAFLSLLFVAGCDDRVLITRDRDVHIPRNATWAWRPVVEEAPAARDNRSADNRPVVSRDEPTRPSRNQPAARVPDPNDEVV